MLSKSLTQQVQGLREVFPDASDEQKQNMLDDINQIILADDPAMRTITIRYSLVKKMFKEITDDKSFLSKIKPDPKITETIIEQNNKIRDDKKLIIIDRADIKQTLSYGFSNDVYDLFIFLLFVTGRRTHELFSANFVNVMKSKNIRIEGVAKRTDEGICEFPPLISKTKFFKIYNRYKKLQHKTNQNTFHRGLNRHIKKVFPNKKWNPHVFRGMYVMYGYKFRNTKRQKINTFIKEHLCHQSINASMNYTQYKLADDVTTDIAKKYSSRY